MTTRCVPRYSALPGRRSIKTLMRLSESSALHRSNESFEDASLTPGVKPFGWTNDSRPQVHVDSDKRPHGGQNSLRFVFRVPNKSDANQVSQTIAVEPATAYRFECYARTENLNS